MDDVTVSVSEKKIENQRTALRNMGKALAKYKQIVGRLSFESDLQEEIEFLTHENNKLREENHILREMLAKYE